MSSTSFSAGLNQLSTLTTSCGQRLRAIIDASKHGSSISNEIMALSNEVHDLGIVLDEVEANHGALSGHSDTTISHLMRRAQSRLSRLDQIIMSSIQLGQSHELVIRKGAWLRRKASCNMMTQDLRNVKQNIVLLLASRTA